METKGLLEEPRKIAIITHPMPDGDAFGSMLGLARVLEAQGHDVYRISPTSWGDFLDWMPDTDRIVDYSADPSFASAELKKATIVYCLDFNEPKRIGVVASAVFTEAHTTILIDHHLEPKLDRFDYGISRPDKSSTAEMVYDYISDMNWISFMDEESRVCLYTGMLTDTGSFRFPATTSSVHRKVADMMDQGLVHSPIHENLFDNNSEERMRFLGFLLSEKLQIIPEDKFAFVGVSKDDMEKYGVTKFDLEGVVNTILSIKGVEVAAMLSERDDEVRLSLRSVGDIDVSEMMRENFNGGGHKNAAGGRSNLNLTDSMDKLKAVVNK